LTTPSVGVARRLGGRVEYRLRPVGCGTGAGLELRAKADFEGSVPLFGLKNMLVARKCKNKTTGRRRISHPKVLRMELP
jgi:hypothetical protein